MANLFIKQFIKLRKKAEKHLLFCDRGATHQRAILSWCQRVQCAFTSHKQINSSQLAITAACRGPLSHTQNANIAVKHKNEIYLERNDFYAIKSMTLTTHNPQCSALMFVYASLLLLFFSFHSTFALRAPTMNISVDAVP